MDLAERIRRVFSSRGLTLYRVSRNSSEVFGHASRFHIPHNFYDSIAEPSFLPSLHQMLALSHITSYRLADWLAVFGIALDDIPRLQLLLPRKRTTLLDASVYDSSAWVPWVAERPRQGDLPPIAPLSQLLAMTFPRRASDLMGLAQRRFLYGKVGDEDLYAFPQLAAGSIVRINPQILQEDSVTSKTGFDSPLFFVEHSGGFTCSQLVSLGRDKILLRSLRHPCAQVELRLGKEARILGIVDAELRPTPEPVRPRAAPCPPAQARTAASARPFSPSQRSASDLSDPRGTLVSGGLLDQPMD
ncbi:MAG: hypothetical protein WA894_03600 [Candidatus Acidiferrum sp.]